MSHVTRERWVKLVVGEYDINGATRLVFLQKTLKISTTKKLKK